MQKKDFYLVGILSSVMLLIFCPVFYTDYVFMDEALQIWNYRPGSGIYMFTGQGRWLTEWLQRGLFERIHTIQEIKYIRILSLLGWLACVPIWYICIKQLVSKVTAYEYLPFFTCLYMITSLPFIVSIQWATCMQFFISYSLGLLSGAVFLKGMHFDQNRLRIAALPAFIALGLGVTSLFLYQSGFGCFLLPFLLLYISVDTTQKDRVLIRALLFYFMVYFVYYLLHKSASLLYQFPHDPRTTLYFNPIEKIKFFLARPLERAFRFTVLIDEDSKPGKIYYMFMLLLLVVLAFIRFGKANRVGAVKYLAATGLIFMLIYLPGLVIKENYASNRTLLALDLAVFMVCMEMAVYFIKNRRWLKMAGVAIAVVFVTSAWYNFQKVFLRPTQQETVALKNYIQKNYHTGIHTIYFIRPSGNLISEKYHIPQSMDEFGVAYSSWDWVPDHLTRQMVYEVTGSRALAAQLVVKQWANRQSFDRSGQTPAAGTLLVDAQEILRTMQP